MFWGKRNKECCNDATLKDSELKELRDQKDTLRRTVESLQAEKSGLKEELAELTLKKKIEDEDIKHMVKIKLDENQMSHDKRMGELEIEFAKKEAKAALEKNEAIGAVKDEYRDKVEKQLKEEGAKMQDMYNQVLSRLPNVNVSLGEATLTPATG